MRFPEKDENLIGKVCINHAGRMAIVIGRGIIYVATEHPGRLKSVAVWQGVGLDGKGRWAEAKPVIAHDTVEELYDTL